ncbi:MAG: hypothetical protein LCH96_11735 [Actinobacteria bacterium]|nr:hypothetical protein [Actinomycetota bacterium]
MPWSRRHTAWSAVALTAVCLAAVANTLVALTPGPSPAPVATSSASATATASTTPSATATAGAVQGVLRVYSNNIENLVTNEGGLRCSGVSPADHLASMLVDAEGRKGTDGVKAPDLLLLQQVSGSEQAEEYAAALAKRFGYPKGTYQSIMVWTDPEPWGAKHDCRDGSLGRLKATQTNAIIFNTRTLELTRVAAYWPAGWLRPGTAYAAGRGCTAYEPPSNDADPARANKWKRTSPVAAQFVVRGTDVTVFASSMHLPRQNRDNPCAGERDPGIDDTGIGFGVDATRLLQESRVRVIGVDANRPKIADDALAMFGATSLGNTRTLHRSKIDYLFVRGDVRASAIDHTVEGTLSNHRALYSFIDYSVS